MIEQLFFSVLYITLDSVFSAFVIYLCVERQQLVIHASLVSHIKWIFYSQVPCKCSPLVIVPSPAFVEFISIFPDVQGFVVFGCYSRAGTPKPKHLIQLVAEKMQVCAQLNGALSSELSPPIVNVLH